MILASHQPDFFPYMGYFYKIFQSDVFVFSDNVLYSKTGRHNYNSILTANGVQRFTLPINYHVVNLNEMQIAADEKYVKKMLKTLWMEYKKAEHFERVYSVMEELLPRALHSRSLADFNYMCILTFCQLFGMFDKNEKQRAYYLSSCLDIKQRRDARIIEICKLFGADVYYSGSGAKDYHIEADYAREGIELVYSDYQPLIYQQANGPKNSLPVENMSVIDYAMNCGFELPRGWKQYE